MWKLGVAGLSPAEAGLVRALVSLAGAGRVPAWAFAGSEARDLLVVDPAQALPHEAAARQGARAVLLLGGGDGPGTLPRPLQRDAFEACLERIARQLPGQPPLAAAPVAGSTSRCAGAERAELRRRYKLLRWPPAELLRGEAHRVRMASQLSRRYLSACELAQLTQQDPERSHTFLQLLQGFRLLEAEQALGAVAGRPRRGGAAPSRGLIASIRRRLGL